MKTVEEFYREISESKELQEELKTAANGMLETFLKKHECKVDVEAFVKFVEEHSEGEIEDEDVKLAAGGSPIFGFGTAMDKPPMAPI